MANLYQTIEQDLQLLQDDQQLRRLGTVTHRDVRYIEFDNKRFLNLSGNDYLALGGNQQILQEFFAELNPNRLLAEFGMAGSSSRLLTGNSQIYNDLENDLATMYQAEAACMFNSGYHANIGIISALANRQDLILADKLNHASMIDGLKLTSANFMRYRHLDYNHLEQLLEKNRAKYRHIFIMTETVFSMDGDIADLQRLVALKKHYQAYLIVDEAHAVGVFGKTGCGICEVQGVVSEIDVIVGTFGKALASIGAFAITNQLLKQYLVNKMRSLIFTTALPPITLNWNRFILQKILTMQTERDQLQTLSNQLRRALNTESLQTRGASQIVPIIIGDNQTTLQLAEQLQAQGVLVFAIRPPTVPPNSARLRLSLNSAMTWQDIGHIPTSVGALQREVALDSAK